MWKFEHAADILQIKSPAEVDNSEGQAKKNLFCIQVILII